MSEREELRPDLDTLSTLSKKEIHEHVRQFEQVTDIIQLHQQSHIDGQTGGVMRICLEDDRSESEGRVIFTVVIKPLQLQTRTSELSPSISDHFSVSLMTRLVCNLTSEYFIIEPLYR